MADRILVFYKEILLRKKVNETNLKEKNSELVVDMALDSQLLHNIIVDSGFHPVSVVKNNLLVKAVVRKGVLKLVSCF